MKQVQLWRWRVPTDTRPGKTHVTRWAMSEAEALAKWPTAEKVGEPELRAIPENADDLVGDHTGTFLHRR
jgi:hypothetical protein